MIGISQDMDDRVVTTIKTLFHERMDEFGLSAVVVRAGEDLDGDPVIFIDASFALKPRPIESQPIFDLERSLRDALWAIGERRFPHVLYKFDDAQTLARHR